jgi:peptidoglycan-associated lipoprotein
MDLLNIKKLLSVVFAAALVVGCSSTDTQDGGQAADAGNNSDASAEVGGALAGLQTVVYFDLDRSEIRGDTKSTLDTWAAALRNGGQNVTLEGHCDERGTNEYNMALGERRANSVVDYLVSQGVARSQLEGVSYGEERPASQGHDESAWSLNRRVELKAK